MVSAAVERITEMERCFDALQTAARENPAAIRTDAALGAMLDSLTEYYRDGGWLQDYALDEQGLLPQSLKRGVLSQDSVYDFLAQMDQWELCSE